MQKSGMLYNNFMSRNVYLILFTQPFLYSLPMKKRFTDVLPFMYVLGLKLKRSVIINNGPEAMADVKSWIFYNTTLDKS